MGRGQALGGRGPERLAEPRELLAGQEALVLLDPEAGDAPGRVAPRGTPAPRIRQIVHLDQNVGRPVGDGGAVVQLVVEAQDVLVLDLRDEALAEGRHDVLVQHDPVVGDGGRLAVHLDIFAEVAVREVGDGGVAGRLGRDRRLARLDADDDLGGFLAGLIGGERVAVLAEGDPLRTAERAGLDDEDLPAGRVDAQAETG